MMKTVVGALLIGLGLGGCGGASAEGEEHGHERKADAEQLVRQVQVGTRGPAGVEGRRLLGERLPGVATRSWRKPGVAPAPEVILDGIQAEVKAVIAAYGH